MVFCLLHYTKYDVCTYKSKAYLQSALIHCLKIINQKSNYLIIKIGQISFLHAGQKLILVVFKLHLHTIQSN